MSHLAIVQEPNTESELAPGEEREALKPLTPEESLVYDEQMAIVRTNLKAFYAVGYALKKIRDMGLYRAEYLTWEDFCKEELDIVKRRADQFIASAAVTDILRNNTGTGTNCSHPGEYVQNEPFGLFPQNEAQVRPLTQFINRPDDLREIWQRVCDQAELMCCRISASLVQKVVNGFMNANEDPKKEEIPAEELRKRIDQCAPEFKEGMRNLLKYYNEEQARGFSGTSKEAFIYLMNWWLDCAKDGKPIDIDNEKAPRKVLKRVQRL